MANKTALVLGCKGQDGSLMCKSLLEKNFKVIGLIRSELKDQSNLHKLGIHQEIELKQGDICDYSVVSSLLETHQPEHVYNLAAQSSVGKSFIKPHETLDSTVNGTLNILNVCKDLNFTGRLFFAGSSEMFGHTEYPADIDHIQNPISPYSIGKQASFNLVKLYRKTHNLKCITGILFNHESHLRNEDFVTQKLIKGAIAISSKKRTSLIKLGNISVIRDWGWAPEYIEAIQIIMTSKHPKDYVICTGKPNSLKSFIDKLFRYFNLDWRDHIEIDQKLFRPNEIKKSYGNPSSLYQDLGWKAREDIDSIIKKLICYSDK